MSHPLEWDESYDTALVLDRCDIDRVEASDLTREEFKKRYYEKQPVVIMGSTDVSTFTRLTKKQWLLDHFGEHTVTLSSANTNSYEKRSAKFSDYVHTMMHPQTLNNSGADTMYHFGDNKHDEWAPLFQHYNKPEQYIFGAHASLSFGLGGSGSGVPFHGHGAVFAEVFHGQKRWFLTPPNEEPAYDGDASSLQWLLQVYPSLPMEQREKVLDCTCRPGDMLYIPGFWAHSTLNIGQTVFMSVFV